MKPIERRAQRLLAAILSGAVRSWHDAMRLRPDDSWDGVRRELKLLREQGLIQTDAEYHTITPMTAKGIVTAEADETRSGSGERSELEPGAEGIRPDAGANPSSPKD